MGTGDRLRILNLEDSPVDSEMVQAMLEAEGIGCELVRVQTQQDFEAALGTGAWDLIVSDYTLPSYNGERALQLVREKYPDVPFIFFSGTLGEEAAVESLRNGATDYVLKHRPARLIPAIRRALDEARERASRHRAEQALRASEERFQRAFAYAPIGMALLSTEGRWLKVNRALCVLVGYSEAEMLARTSQDLTHADDLPADLEQVRRLLAGEIRTYELEKRYFHKQGYVVWCLLSVSMAQASDGSPAYFIVQVQDVGGRRRAEASIRQHAEGLARAQATAHLGNWGWDIETGAALWSDEQYRIFGYTPQEVPATYELLVQAVHPDDRKSLRRTLRQALAEEQPCDAELRVVRPDGSARFVQLRAEVRRDAEGRPVRLEGTALDLTERRQAEAERSRLAAAVEQAAEAIVITDPTGVIQYTNPAFTRITGYSAHEAIGQTPRVLKSGKQDRAFYEGLWQTIGQGQVWRGHFINRRKDGSLYEEDAAISPVKDAADTIVSFVAVKRDVTREVALQAQLRQSQKMEAIGLLAGGVAHDFNNLLTVIMGSTEILKTQLPANAETDAELAELLTATRRAADLTRQLLVFSRRQVIQRQVLDLNQLVENLRKMLRRVIGEDIDLCFTPCQEPASVSVDPGQLEQVIMNLVINARDAMPKGGKLTLSTAVVALGLDDEHRFVSGTDFVPGAYVLLAIGDTGCGMDKTVLAHVCEPFFTTKEKGKGTGLGLATVFGIVKQHGGQLEIESEPGRGTAIRVYLPCDAPAAAQAVAGRDDPVPRGNETILMVEDETPVRTVAAHMLRSLGYTVLEADSGDAAIRRVTTQTEPIHLVVTDVVMPGMDGKTLVTRLRAVRPGLRALFVSGYPDDRIVTHGVLAPGLVLVNKPFSRETIARKVREVLDGPGQA